MEQGAAELTSADANQRGDIIEFWIECVGCERRVNILDRLPECGCEPTFWLVVPELTKRAALASRA
jgi:hypothetical protein